MAAKRGDLVITPDGYYGIVVGERDVFLANGLRQVLDDDQFAALLVLPLGANYPIASPANFAELIAGYEAEGKGWLKPD